MTDGRIDLGKHVRDIPDFPKEGILFRDIMPLLQDPLALREAVDRIIEYGTGKHIDMVLGAEARGFILGAAVAYGLGAGFVAIYLLDLLRQRRRSSWWPLVPGAVLVAVGLLQNTTGWGSLGDLGWPLLLIVAGVIVVGVALARRGRRG